MTKQKWSHVHWCDPQIVYPLWPGFADCPVQELSFYLFIYLKTMHTSLWLTIKIKGNFKTSSDAMHINCFTSCIITVLFPNDTELLQNFLACSTQRGLMIGRNRGTAMGAPPSPGLPSHWHNTTGCLSVPLSAAGNTEEVVVSATGPLPCRRLASLSSVFPPTPPLQASSRALGSFPDSCFCAQWSECKMGRTES